MSKWFGSSQEYSPVEVMNVILSALAYTMANFFLVVFRWFFKQPKDITGEVALITGAGRGLGRNLALKLASNGCHVAIVDVDFESAKKTAEDVRKLGVKSEAYKADVTKIEQLRDVRDKVMEELGPVSILVNNAGLLFSPPFLQDDDYTNKGIEKVIDVNFNGLIWATKVFLPTMVTRKKGHIVTMCSMTAYYPWPNNTVYAATKYAVRGFMDGLAFDLHIQNLDEHIKLTTIFPYFIDTQPEVSKLIQNQIIPQFLLDQYYTANEIVNSILYEHQALVLPKPFYIVMILNLPRYFWLRFLRTTFRHEDVPRWIDQLQKNESKSTNSEIATIKT